MAQCLLPGESCAVAFSPLGDLIALAQGSGVQLLHTSNLVEAGSILALEPGISAQALAFAPDGGVLAIGTDGGSIELRSTRGSWERLGICRGHNGPVVNLDWSESGNEFQSNSSR